MDGFLWQSNEFLFQTEFFLQHQSDQKCLAGVRTDNIIRPIRSEVPIHFVVRNHLVHGGINPPTATRAVLIAAVVSKPF